MSEHTGAKKRNSVTPALLVTPVGALLMPSPVNTTDRGSQAIPDFLQADYVPGGGDTSPAQSDTSIDATSRRFSFLSFIVSTAPTAEEAIRLGRDNQISTDEEGAKTVGHSRRKKILRFFGRHHKKQKPKYVSKQPRPSFCAELVHQKGTEQRLLDAWV